MCWEEKQGQIKIQDVPALSCPVVSRQEEWKEAQGWRTAEARRGLRAPTSCRWNSVPQQERVRPQPRRGSRGGLPPGPAFLGEASKQRTQEAGKQLRAAAWRGHVRWPGELHRVSERATLDGTSEPRPL